MAQETAEVVDYSSYSFWGMVTIKVEPAIRGIVGVIVRVKSIQLFRVLDDLVKLNYCNVQAVNGAITPEDVI